MSEHPNQSFVDAADQEFRCWVCPACGGSGDDYGWICCTCDGTGRIGPKMAYWTFRYSLDRNGRPWTGTLRLLRWLALHPRLSRGRRRSFISACAALIGGVLLVAAKRRSASQD